MNLTVGQFNSHVTFEESCILIGRLGPAHLSRVVIERARSLTKMDALEQYLRDIDDGLIVYKEEFVKFAVKSDATLKYLRPYEVEGMDIPPVYRRMLVERIVNLQTPSTKAKMKEQCLEDLSQRTQPKAPKRLRFEQTVENPGPCTQSETSATPTPSRVQKPRTVTTPDNFLEKEVERLKEEKDTLSVLLVHKKDELTDLKRIPTPLSAISIPGNPITKSSCDNCHRKGHRALMNRGNKSCPFMTCEGYHVCGLEGKHPDHKQSVTEVTKEINDIERRFKNINDELNSIKMFQKHNNTNFISVMRPILKALFSVKYEGKDGSQNLQRDLRYIKIATNGQVPEVQTRDHITNLISKGKSRVSSTVTDSSRESDTTPKELLENQSAPTYASPPISFTQQPLNFQNQLGQCNPYFSVASPPTLPYQYVVYPNHWNAYSTGNSYMYPTNPVAANLVASSTAPECTAIPPLPLDPPPENPPLPKDAN